MEKFYPQSSAEWRQWLIENHESEQSVWLILNKKSSGKSYISWSEAVDEALCFGWIDSKKQTIDEHTYQQFYCKRKAQTTWSKVNKDKVKKLIEEGKMMPAGKRAIDVAKKNGSWTIFDDVEKLIIPEDLELAFTDKPGAKEYFISLSKSNRKSMLHWIVLAKRESTRMNRINEIVDCAALKKKPKHIS